MYRILISRNGDGERAQEDGSLTWRNGEQAICGEGLGGEGLECQAKQVLYSKDMIGISFSFETHNLIFVGKASLLINIC